MIKNSTESFIKAPDKTPPNDILCISVNNDILLKCCDDAYNFDDCALGTCVFYYVFMSCCK